MQYTHPLLKSLSANVKAHDAGQRLTPCTCQRLSQDASQCVLHGHLFRPKEQQ